MSRERGSQKVIAREFANMAQWTDVLSLDDILIPSSWKGKSEYSPLPQSNGIRRRPSPLAPFLISWAAAILLGTFIPQQSPQPVPL